MLSNSFFKNMLSIIITITIIIGMLAGCQQKELLYSCDPEINDWVVKTKSLYTDISRDELATFDYDKQDGLWVSFSPEQKAKIFQSKYQYLIELNTLSEEEKEYLTDLYRQVTPVFYSSEKERVKVVEYYEKWKYEVMDKLGWERIDVYFYAETWFTYEEFWQWVEFKKNQQSSTLKSTRAELNCDCINASGCLWAGSLCSKGNCKVGVKKCGAAKNEDCTGLCD